MNPCAVVKIKNEKKKYTPKTNSEFTFSLG